MEIFKKFATGMIFWPVYIAIRAFDTTVLFAYRLRHWLWRVMAWPRAVWAVVRAVLKR